MSDDSHFEPVYGLPGLLPEGERILWQGAPRWQGLARRAFRLGVIGCYFGALFAWDIAGAVYAGRSPLDILQTMFVPVVLALTACVSLAAVAYLSARSTVYTITTRRVAIRTGIAFSVTINLPYTLIDGVSRKTYRDDKRRREALADAGVARALRLGRRPDRARVGGVRRAAPPRPSPPGRCR